MLISLGQQAFVTWTLDGIKFMNKIKVIKDKIESITTHLQRIRKSILNF